QRGPESDRIRFWRRRLKGDQRGGKRRRRQSRAGCGRYRRYPGDRRRLVGDRRGLPVPESRIVDDLGGIAMSEFRFGEDSARGQTDQLLLARRINGRQREPLPAAEDGTIPVEDTRVEWHDE